MRRRDARTGQEPGHRVPASVTTTAGIQHLELALQVRRAGRDLVGLRVAVVGRPALHDVRDEHVLPAPADRPISSVEQLARRPTKGRPWASSFAGALADEDDLGLRSRPRPGRPSFASRGAGSSCTIRTSAAMASSACWRSSVGHGVAPTTLAARYGRAPRADADLSQSRSRRISASSTALVAAPLRRLSETTQKARPRSSSIETSAADPADEDLVAPGRLGRQRVAVVAGVVLDDDARDGGEQRARAPA